MKIKDKTPRKPGARKVEEHPQFDEILKALVAGQPIKAIQRWMWPKMDFMAISRFKRFRMAQALENVNKAPITMAMALKEKGLLPDTKEVADVVAATAAAMVNDDPLVARIKKHQDLVDERLKNPKLTAGATAVLINTDLRGIELYAKLTNRLQAPATGVNITIVNPQPAQRGDILSPIIDIGVEQ